MYHEFYGLTESPFALTPDPRYLFLSEPHKEALASAIYGVQERKGFVLILGEVGTGKTTLIRHLLGRFGPNIRTVFVFNPGVTFLELLQIILRDLELSCSSLRRVEMIDTLNEYLLAEATAGRYVVLIIDEAQHLSPAVLEEVRMLSNLETTRGKLIQTILVGQPELGDKLGRPELRQLRQRIGLVAELKPLALEDAIQYIDHRLEVAGHKGEPIFTRRALRLIHRASDGIPRLINVICDKALVLGYAAGARKIRRKVIREVLKDWAPFRRRRLARPSAAASGRGRPRVRARRRLSRLVIALAIVAAGGALALALLGHREGRPPRVIGGLGSAGATATSPAPAPAGPTPRVIREPARPAPESAAIGAETRALPAAGREDPAGKPPGAAAQATPTQPAAVASTPPAGQAPTAGLAATPPTTGPVGTVGQPAAAGPAPAAAVPAAGQPSAAGAASGPARSRRAATTRRPRDPPARRPCPSPRADASPRRSGPRRRRAAAPRR